MSLLGLIVLLVVIGFACWLISLVPMTPRVRQIVIGVIIFLTVIYILTNVLPAFLSGHPLHGLR